VAVLYFDNLSRDTSDAYLAEGLTEEITSRLGAVERLRVTGRTLVRRAQDASAGDPTAVAQRLGVRYLVEGSVRRSGSRVRVSVRLLRAADGVRLWGDDYNRAQTDLLDIQDAIAREVVTNIAGRLLPTDRARLAARPTRSAVAYDLYLRGNYELAQRTGASLARAIANYEEALRRDPGFAAAQSRIAYAYTLGIVYGLEGVNADTILSRAVAAAERALLVSPNQADTWLAWGWLRTIREPRTFDGVAAAYERAVTLDPQSAEARHRYAQALFLLGADSLAAAAYELALDLEPGRVVTLVELSAVRHLQRRLADAHRLADSAARIDPRQARAYIMRARAHLGLGNTAAARRDAATALPLASGLVRLEAATALAIVAVAEGDTSLARAFTAEMERELGEHLGFANAYVALVMVAVGDTTRALDILARTPPSVLLAWVLRFPEFDGLRRLPQFQRVVEATRPPALLR
jgi:TolB-like protein/Flp pilus assembly protein TadD